MRPPEWAPNSKPQFKEFWSKIGLKGSERSKLRDYVRDKLWRSRSMTE